MARMTQNNAPCGLHAPNAWMHPNMKPLWFKAATATNPGLLVRLGAISAVMLSVTAAVSCGERTQRCDVSQTAREYSRGVARLPPDAVGLACAQQPRQMFPIARSTSASSGVGLSMASGTEGTSADVG
jgi:hypothetical protein